MGQTTRSPFFKIINQIGTLKCDDGDGDGKENVNKAMGLHEK